MSTKQKHDTLTEIVAQSITAYDVKPLAAALTTLSITEIEAMLVNIASLETQIAKLNVAGEDVMMRVVTEGLNRLTYLLDAVKMHKDGIVEE